MDQLLTDILIIVILMFGISLFRTPSGARAGNMTAAFALLLSGILVVTRNTIHDPAYVMLAILAGSAAGWTVAMRVNMIQIPAMVAFQHGAGGVAAFLISFVELLRTSEHTDPVAKVAGILGLVIGAATFSGSMIAGGKLSNKLKQTPAVITGHSLVLSGTVAAICIVSVLMWNSNAGWLCMHLGIVLVLSMTAGVLFAMRIGGADMPVLISFLNATAGLAAAFCGIIIGHKFLIACGAVVCASGSILTHMMCKAMNRSLLNIFTGSAMRPGTMRKVVQGTAEVQETTINVHSLVNSAQRVIIVPGYGMALAQAQMQVKSLFDHLTAQGKDVRFAIHPVAGRMPGHMNILLAEADITYDCMYDIDSINPEFAGTDVVIIVGACDVVNPAAMTSGNSSLAGMPVLRTHEARNVIVFNMNTLPGYSGVENTLYTMPNVTLMLGNASTTLEKFLNNIKHSALEIQMQSPGKFNIYHSLLHGAAKVVIVPGYGMALAQAQWQVKSLFEYLTAQGTDVKFAIHPVAGRMPGHMNVLLAEVDIPYDYLKDIDAINPDFADTDVVIIVGACDVINPEAMTAEGTPIYGMPILRVHEAKHIIVCNKDTKPGYSGVENTLYGRKNVSLLLGNASETLGRLLNMMKDVDKSSDNLPQTAGHSFYELFEQARRIVIIPGYGMALAQAQWQVKSLFEYLIAQGKDVRFAIHPVAGRMPGHMNVLLAEVDIPYDYLKDIDSINPDFAGTDVVIVVGACDVVNPEAMTAEGTPIYGMPILRAHEAKQVIVCNLDTKPGYSGVENTLYNRENVTFLPGNAALTLEKLLNSIKTPKLIVGDHDHVHENTFYKLLRSSRKVIIVPGYGMALAQAQWQVKSLFEHLTAQGTDVKFAIHPVAGRMPGHMNVLLAEVDIPYDYLKDIDAINPDFADTDVVIIVGACDVVNPEAMTAEGTPIYGMPILRVHEAKHIIVCNKDTNPGYSGVPNSLYGRDNVSLLLGNAAETLDTLVKQARI